MTNQWPIIVVTGANGGIGFGICQRLLYQLSEPLPSDAKLLVDRNISVEGDIDRLVTPCKGLTLILACRNKKRADAAREKLLTLLDEHIERLKKREGYDGHAQVFRENVRIEFHELDLGMLSTVSKFSRELKENYPYISHLFCNAGVATFFKIDWWRCAKQFLNSPFGAVTTPMFYSETWGEVSIDGYGWVWQCNVFGHYVLFRDLQPLLLSSRYPMSSRVIWTSSLKAFRDYTSEDWQLKLTEAPYNASKYQTELIATHLDRCELQKAPREKRVRHFISHPGVCHTNIDLNLIPPILHYVKWLVFHFIRLLGSKNHPISFEKGALSGVWLSIVSLASVSVLFSEADKNATVGNGHSGYTNGHYKHEPHGRPPVKFGSCCDRWGNPIVGVFPIEGWDAQEAERLVEKCEEAYLKEKNHQRWRPTPETASEKM
ncbi:3-keto sterol reductase [Marasmius fiardii PR-910]|nr:3-keto sterol reductase [Marasmius fiardii PR-910]